MSDPIDDFETGLTDYGPPEAFTPHGDDAEGTPGLKFGDVDAIDSYEFRDESMSKTDDEAPLADGDTVHIHAPDPLRITRAGTTYHAQDIDDEGDPVGDPWALSKGAVRGLLGRHDWTRVEATASVRDSTEERQ